MAITARQADFDTPSEWNIQVGTGQPISGSIINVGDWIAYSGQNLFPTNAGHSAYWKASGQGIALESNPTYDNAGRVVQNTAMLFMREGLARVSAGFSGSPALGQGVYPISTGSGVAAPTGQSGVGARWQTSVKLPISGGTGAGGSGVATIIGSRQNGNGGTGELDILLTPPRPDYY